MAKKKKKKSQYQSLCFYFTVFHLHEKQYMLVALLLGNSRNTAVCGFSLGDQWRSYADLNTQYLLLSELPSTAKGKFLFKTYGYNSSTVLIAYDPQNQLM